MSTISLPGIRITAVILLSLDKGYIWHKVFKLDGREMVRDLITIFL